MKSPHKGAGLMVRLCPEDRSALKTSVHWRQMCTGHRCAREASVHWRQVRLGCWCVGDRSALK